MQEAYDREHIKAFEALRKRKPWVEKANMVEFFGELKKKMSASVQVDLGLACKLALAYLALENSAAVSFSLDAREREGTYCGRIGG